MSPHDCRHLKARCVFPVAGPPIRDGVLTIEGQRIAAVGRKAAGSGKVEDLGNVAILPGLVNAHTHLEFSDLPGPLGEPGIGLVAWIRRVMAYRRETADRPRDPVAQGLRESTRLGTAALGEIAQPGWIPQPFLNSPVNATVFLELIAPTHERIAPALELATRHLADGSDAMTLWRPGLSPHAPYSVRKELLESLVRLSAGHRVPLAFHLAESREELELLRSARGPLCEFLQSLGVWDPSAFPPDTRPLDYLRILARADRALVIHGNYLDDEEIALLSAHAGRMSLVYCPRTHAWFRHERYPLEKLLAAGVSVALGTDSRASAPDLDMLAEMRFVARHYPAIPPEAILEMGTLRAARALGCDDRFGSLAPGKRANLAIVPLPDHDSTDPYDLLFHHAGPLHNLKSGTMDSMVI